MKTQGHGTPDLSEDLLSRMSLAQDLKAEPMRAHQARAKALTR